ncbi:MAG: hypothetical protein HY744_26850 [Deltaproteobacteria bacterium]|nr:hypothetical protein [Deltaproteobacteria bacterium]
MLASPVMRNALRCAALLALLLPLACAKGARRSADDGNEGGAGAGGFAGPGAGGSGGSGGGTSTATGGTGGGPSEPPSGGACYAGFGECNPMQSTCGAGYACDLSNDNLFHCFEPPNDVPVGGACNAQSGPFCQSGAFCLDGTCRAYCCTTGDCPNCQSQGTVGSLEIKLCI